MKNPAFRFSKFDIFSLSNITTKFQVLTSKTVGRFEFIVDVWVIGIKVLACTVFKCIFDI